MKEVARAAFQPGRLPPDLEGGLYETGTFRPAADTFPNGCHICELEIDRETGAVEVIEYTVVDDVGTVINPTTLKGQIHGGVAQGLGQALMEEVAYDPTTGQLLTGTFMDYAMPRADDFSAMHILSMPVPTKLNPLGAKGAGEAGTVGALPAVMNAVLEALAPLGVRDLEMPATSEKIWRAIRAAVAR
jgi:carbon-monoxide dehydrogenase large subunit